MLWNFSLILYVSFASVVCYIVGIEIPFFFCCRQQEKNRRVGESELPGMFFVFQQLSISVPQYPCGLWFDLHIEMSNVGIL